MRGKRDKEGESGKAWMKEARFGEYARKGGREKKSEGLETVCARARVCGCVCVSGSEKEREREKVRVCMRVRVCKGVLGKSFERVCVRVCACGTANNSLACCLQRVRTIRQGLLQIPFSQQDPSSVAK